MGNWGSVLQEDLFSCQEVDYKCDCVQSSRLFSISWLSDKIKPRLSENFNETWTFRLWYIILQLEEYNIDVFSRHFKIVRKKIFLKFLPREFKFLYECIHILEHTLAKVKYWCFYFRNLEHWRDIDEM